MKDAVVEVEGDFAFGYLLESVVVFMALVEALAGAVKVFALTGGELLGACFHRGDFVFEPLDVFQQIVGAYLADGILVHTVGIDKHLEGTLLR